MIANLIKQDKKRIRLARVMAQWLRTALAEDPCSVPNTLVKWLKTA